MNTLGCPRWSRSVPGSQPYRLTAIKRHSATHRIRCPSLDYALV